MTDVDAVSEVPELVLAAEVARRHYLREESKTEIAADLGLSRFKVARLLIAARDAGLVRIEVRDPQGLVDPLATELEKRFQLRGAVVVPGESGAAGASDLGAAAADFLASTVTAQDVLGLPWARTVACAVRELGQRTSPPLPPVPVVQLCGSMVLPGQATPVDVVRDAARVTGGAAYIFHAPLIMPSATGAAAVRQQDDVCRAMTAADAVTIAVCSIGGWSAGTSTVFDKLSPADRVQAENAGVVAESMGLLLNGEGRVVMPEVGRRIVTISEDQWRAIPLVVALARGAERAEATRAVLASGVVTHLIVDQVLARAVLG